jgi:ADP-ribose pyrophosphatase YjhB (NUDIX family)
VPEIKKWGLSFLGYIEDIRKLVGHRPLILVGSIVIVLDEKGRLLLQQRKQPSGFWGIPGGLMELGESVEDTAKRELFEETNLRAENLNLINVYSGPNNYIKAANDDEFYLVTTAFYSNDITGDLIVDEAESMDFRYYRPDQLPTNIVKSHALVLEEFMERFYHKIY